MKAPLLKIFDKSGQDQYDMVIIPKKYCPVYMEK